MSNLSDEAISKRMTPHQRRVGQFMDTVRHLTEIDPLPNIPVVPKSAMSLAQARLILEEALEVFDACGLELHVVTKGTEFGEQIEGSSLTKANLILTPKKDVKISVPEVAKELADLSVVTTGMFNEFGICDAPILEEVDANNLAKFGPGGFLDANRKWRKPPNHPKPDIATLLKAQGWVDPETATHEKESTVRTEDVPVSN